MRIVSLLPSATEILFALGLGEQVVGVTHECDFPPEARAKPRLTSSSLPDSSGSAEVDRHVRARLHSGSSIYRLDAELLAQLAPDLIVTQELCPVCAVSYELVTQATKRLKGDPRIVSLEPSSLDDVYATIESVGALTKTEAKAKIVVGELRAREKRLSSLTRDLSRPRALVLEWTDPPMSGGHWTPGLVELAGGLPVLANAGANSQRIAWEDIALGAPDVVIVAPCGYNLETAVRETGPISARLPVSPAVVDGNAYVNRPGPRLLDTAEIFAAIIHPEIATRLPAYPNAWRRLGG